MTLDATKPLDTILVSDLPAYIRENRVEMNALTVSLLAQWTETEIEIAGGTTELEVGVDLTDVPVEVVRLTGAVAVTIDTISEGRSGHIKLLRFEDTNVTLDDGGGNIQLNQPAAIGTFTGAVGDILILLNIDGNPGVDDGDWVEVNRLLTV